MAEIIINNIGSILTIAGTIAGLSFWTGVFYGKTNAKINYLEKIQKE